MNYLEQINLFNDLTEVNDISMAAQCLWYKLMHLNNRSFWTAEMKVSNQTLMGYLKINSAATLIKARNDLIGLGLLDYQNGVYHMKELTKDGHGIRAVNAAKDCSNGTEEDTEINIEPVEESAEEELKKKKKADPIPYDEIQNYWNDNRTNGARVDKMNDQRKRKIRRLINDGYSLEDVKKVILKTSQSQWLNNGSDGSWAADFDWIIKPDRFLQILEGTFDTKSNGQNNEQTLVSFEQEDLYAAYR